jgi:transposase-like protein
MPEFKAEAVKLVTEHGLHFVEAAHDLDVGQSTPRSRRQAIVADAERAFTARATRRPTRTSCTVGGTLAAEQISRRSAL